MRTACLLILLSLFGLRPVLGQDDLMALLDDEPNLEYTTAAFKAGKIVLGQSIENAPLGGLVFGISHHFGRINSGLYEFFGLDQSNIRLSFDYGVTNWLTLGIGWTSTDKIYDGSAKVKLLRQSTGKKNMPLSVSYWGNITITSLKWSEPERENYFTSRMQYGHQLLIARKFNSNLTLQLTPTLIHRNLVETIEDQNNVWAIGAGGRYKLSSRISFNMEYFYLLPGKTADDYCNSFSFGVDIETGGHVFQLFFTNSLGLVEQQFIPETTGNWLNGDIHIGFNIHRTFQVRKPKTPEDH